MGSPAQLAADQGKSPEWYETENSDCWAIYKSMGNITLSRVPPTRVHSRMQPCSSVDAKHNQLDLEPETEHDPVLQRLNGLLPGGLQNVCSNDNADQATGGLFI